MVCPHPLTETPPWGFCTSHPALSERNSTASMPRWSCREQCIINPLRFVMPQGSGSFSHQETTSARLKQRKTGHLHYLLFRVRSTLFVRTAVCTGGQRNATHNTHDSLWPLKFLAVAGCLGGFLFLPDPAMFGVYAEVARVLSLLWMLFQVRNLLNEFTTIPVVFQSTAVGVLWVLLQVWLVVVQSTC